MCWLHWAAFHACGELKLIVCGFITGGISETVQIVPHSGSHKMAIPSCAVCATV